MGGVIWEAGCRKPPFGVGNLGALDLGLGKLMLLRSGCGVVSHAQRSGVESGV